MCLFVHTEPLATAVTKTRAMEPMSTWRDVPLPAESRMQPELLLFEVLTLCLVCGTLYALNMKLHVDFINCLKNKVNFPNEKGKYFLGNSFSHTSIY